MVRQQLIGYCSTRIFLRSSDGNAVAGYMKRRGAEAQLEGVEIEIEPVKYVHGGNNVELTTEQWRRIQHAWKTFFKEAQQQNDMY